MAVFGYDTAGTNADYTFSLGSDSVMLGKFTLSEDGSVTKLTASLSVASASVNLKGCIYDDDGTTTYPGTLLGVTSGQAVGPQAQGWVDFTFGTSVVLSAGNYWLGVIQQSTGGAATGAFYADASGGSSGYEAMSYASPTDLALWANPNTYKFSVYATYTTGAWTGLRVTRHI